MSKNIHPLTWVEVIEHSLQLYENGKIEIEQLAAVVYHISRILGLTDIAEEVRKMPRRAVRHAVRIMDNYLKPGSQASVPVIASLTFDELLNILKKMLTSSEQSEESSSTFTS